MRTCTYTHKIIKLKTYTHPTLTLSLYSIIPSLYMITLSTSVYSPLSPSPTCSLILINLTHSFTHSLSTLFPNYPNKTPTLRITKKNLNFT